MNPSRPLCLALAAALVATGCFTPPVLMPGGHPELDPTADSYPPGSERVELRADEDTVLRGVFMPSDPGAPVVLHLLESGGSVTGNHYDTVNLNFGGRAVWWQLADRGYASLCIDYAGVGASDGEADVHQLPRDARAAWDEAVRRAGGPERVLVRGISLGAVAAAGLLDEGARPAAVVLAAPVDPDTVVERYGELAYGVVLTWLAELVFADPSEVDLAATLAAGHVPVAVWGSQGDELLPPEDAEPLQAALESAGGTWHDQTSRGMTLGQLVVKNHVRLATGARSMLPEEADWLRERLPVEVPVAARRDRVLTALEAVEPGSTARLAPGTVARARLEALVARRLHVDPRVLAAAALVQEEPDPGLLSWLRGAGADWVSGLSLDELLARLDLSDPAGELDADVLRWWTGLLKPRRAGARPARPAELFHDLRVLIAGVGHPSVEKAVRRLNTSETNWYGQDMRRVWDRVGDAGLADDDRARLLVRTLLRAGGFDERVVRGEDGALLVEVDVAGARHLVDPVFVLEAPADGATDGTDGGGTIAGP